MMVVQVWTLWSMHVLKSYMSAGRSDYIFHHSK